MSYLNLIARLTGRNSEPVAAGAYLPPLPRTIPELRAELQALYDASNAVSEAADKVPSLSDRGLHYQRRREVLDALAHRVHVALRAAVFREKAAQVEKETLQELKQAGAAITAASSELAKARQARAGFEQRLHNLKEELAKLEAVPHAQLVQARQRLEAAVASGDEAQEAAAAAEIDRLEREAETNSRAARPLRLRIEAMEAQDAAAQAPVNAAEQALHRAEWDQAATRFELAAIRCDLAHLAALAAEIELRHVAAETGLRARIFGDDKVTLRLGMSVSLVDACGDDVRGLPEVVSAYGIEQQFQRACGPSKAALAVLDVDPAALSDAPRKPPEDPKARVTHQDAA